MPLANINVLEGHPRAVLKELLREVSVTYARILDAPLERLQVWITEIDPGLYAVGGVPADEVMASGESLSDTEIPLARLVLMQGRPAEQFAAAIVELTEVISRVLGTDQSRVRVECQPVDVDYWGIGGVPASVKRKAELEDRSRIPRS